MSVGFGSSNIAASAPINVRDYGALGNGKIAFLASITAGSHTLTLLYTTTSGVPIVQPGTSQDTFTSSDVGKTIVVSFAGTTGGSGVQGDLVTTITGYTSPTVVTLSAAAVNTPYYPSQCHWYTTGTNDQPAFQAAANAASVTQSTLYIPAGVYILGNTNSAQGMIQSSSSVAPYLGAIVGDGPTRTWLCAANTSQVAHMMLLTDVPAGFVLRGFSTRGPSQNATAGGGIVFGLSNNYNVNGILVEEVDVWQTAEDGFTVNTPILTTFVNCNASNTLLDGYHVYAGTSTHFDTCYATANNGAGFHFDGVTVYNSNDGMEYCSLNACASESNGIAYFFDNAGACVANGCGFEETQATTGGLYIGHGFVISGGQGGIVLSGCYGTGIPSTSAMHVYATASCPGASIIGYDMNDAGNPTYFQLDSGCSNIQFINPSDVTFSNLSDAGTNTLFSQGMRQNRIGGLGTPATTGAFALSGWGTSPSVTITNANSTDAGGTVTIHSGSGSPSANPTVTYTFENGTWTNIPVVVASRGDTTAPTTGFWVVTMTATTAVFKFVGTPAASSAYLLNWVTMGT